MWGIPWRQLVISTAILVVGFVAGYFVHQLVSGEVLLPLAVRKDLGYTFIKPVLYCTSGQKEFTEFDPLEKKVQRIAEDLKTTDPASQLSVYMRDLDTGAWMGVDENEHYIPASLLKVPTMIAYYKYAESHPSILEKNVSYDGSFDNNIGENFTSSHYLRPGVYTIEELIRAMIVSSDNNALELLRRNIKADYLLEVFTDLGLPLPPESDNVEFMSPKSYALFFRTLYNATYLNHDYSEHALELLSRAEFKDGIREPLPTEIAVASKFGERSVVTLPSLKVVATELHDCGIVYREKDPYLLCVMTRGKGFPELLGAMHAVSKAAYEYLIP